MGAVLPPLRLVGAAHDLRTDHRGRPKAIGEAPSGAALNAERLLELFAGATGLRLRPHHPAAVDIQGLAGDPAPGVGNQKEQGSAKIVG